MHRLGIVLVLCGLICLQHAQAQRVRWAGDEHKAWSIDVQPMGLEVPLHPIVEEDGLQQRALGYSAQVGLRYMITHHVGVRPYYGFHQFFSLDDSGGNLRMHRYGVELVGNLSEFFPFQGEQYFRRFNALVHAGGGPVIGITADGARDRMGSVTVGVTPQYRLGWRMAVFADARVNGTVSQHRAFTGTELALKEQGWFMTIGLGLQYYIGSPQRHADWR